MVSVCLPSDALLATPTVLLGSLLPWTWGISSWLLQQSTAAAPYLGQVTPPDLEHGVAPLGPPVPTQPPLLGHGVAPLGSHPWPQARGSSSRPYFLLGLSQPPDG